MLRLRKINPMVRAIGTMGAVAAVAGGFTFAQLTSNTVALSGDSVDSGTAALQISTDNITYGDTATGFTFTGLTPGVTASPNQTFYVKNTGTTDLVLNAAISALPTWSGTVNNSLVRLNVSCVGLVDGSPTITLPNPGNDMTSLDTTGGTNFIGGVIKAGDTDQCTANASMDAGAFTGSGVTETNTFDLDLTGTSS
jgi:hypothetical protein